MTPSYVNSVLLDTELKKLILEDNNFKLALRFVVMELNINNNVMMVTWLMVMDAATLVQLKNNGHVREVLLAANQNALNTFLNKLS